MRIDAHVPPLGGFPSNHTKRLLTKDGVSCAFSLHCFHGHKFALRHMRVSPWLVLVGSLLLTRWQSLVA
eukprot:scaffold2636_cov340-Pavlova_lutheri.AAC.125